MFVERKNGVVAGCYANRQEGYAEEQIADDHPDVVAFLNPPAPTAAQIEQFCKDALTNYVGRIDPLKLFKAKMVSDLAFRLGKAPGALTNAELVAERDRIAAIYKAL